MLLIDSINKAISISYKLERSRRFSHFVLSVEVVAFADLFNDSLSIPRKLGFFLKYPIPVHMQTDSKSIFDIIPNKVVPLRSESCWIYGARQAHKSHEISTAEFMRKSQNLPDGFTKPKV